MAKIGALKETVKERLELLKMERDFWEERKEWGRYLIAVGEYARKLFFIKIKGE